MQFTSDLCHGFLNCQLCIAMLRSHTELQVPTAITRMTSPARRDPRSTEDASGSTDVTELNEPPVRSKPTVPKQASNSRLVLSLKPSIKAPGRRENHEACSPHTPTCHLTAEVPLLCCTIFPRELHLSTPSFMDTHARKMRRRRPVVKLPTSVLLPLLECLSLL